MTTSRRLLASLTLVLALSSAACDDGTECPGGDCVVAVPPIDTTPDRDPSPCLDACRNLLGACADTAQLQADADVERCDRECRAEFEQAEIDCLAGLSCGDAAEACYE